MGEEDTEILFLSFQAETAKITMNRAIKSAENVGVKNWIVFDYRVFSIK